MKFKIMLVIMLVVFGLFGFKNVRAVLPNIQSLSTLEETIAEQQSNVNSLTDALKSSVNSTEGMLINGVETNLQIAEKISNLEGCSLINISALKGNNLDAMDTVLTITNVEEVSYFTDTIDEMSFTLNVSDLGQAFKSIADMEVCLTSFNYNTETAVLVLNVKTVTNGITVEQNNNSLSSTEETDSIHAGVGISTEILPIIDDSSSEMTVSEFGTEENIEDSAQEEVAQ